MRTENHSADYQAFGSPLNNRTFSSDDYKHGFNGQMKDDEIAGSGNSYTAEYWQYDSRLGRRWNTDPLHQFNSPYVAFGNNPIYYIDPNGAWVPGADKDGNITLTAEKDDDFISLMDFFKNNNLSKEQIEGLAKTVSGFVIGQDKGKETIEGNSINLTSQLGGVFKEMSDAYNETMTTECNCWGTALEVAKSQDVDIYRGIPTPEDADKQLQKENQSIPEDKSVVGQSVVRFADPANPDKNKIGGTTHFATYMGKDRSGRGYVFTKNGWVYKWDVQRIGDFHVPDNNKRPERGLRFSDYGLPTSLEGDLSPYYGPK